MPPSEVVPGKSASARLEPEYEEFRLPTNIDEDDDMLSAMARELVERNGIGESADAGWKALNPEHHELFAGGVRIKPKRGFDRHDDGPVRDSGYP